MCENSDQDPSCPVCHINRWQYMYRRQGWDFLRCCSCELARLGPIPTNEQLTAYYASRFKAGNYEPGKALERLPTLNGIFDLISGRAPGKIFDVGCFDGGLLDIAKGAGWDAWGLEFQGPAVEIAQSKHGSRVAVGSLEEFETPAYDFDVVTAIGLIEHLRRPSVLCQFASRVLKTGGILIVQTPDASSIPARALGRYWPPIAPPEHIWYFNRKNLATLLSASGFQQIVVRSHWKPLRIGYMYDQLSVFGPELQRLVRPLRRFPALMNQTVKMYGGEMLVTATRS